MRTPDAGPSISAEGGARPNPFALPSGASLRFALLGIAVVVSAGFIYQYAYFAYDPNARRFGSDFVRCSAEAGKRSSDTFRRSMLLDACMVAENQAQVVWIVLGVLALLSLTAIIYRLLPEWRVRRHRLRPIPDKDAREIVQSLTHLASHPAALQPQPQFFWESTDGAIRAFAFGRRRSPRIAISGGLATVHVTDPGRFRAIILHEMAHIRNHDVDKAYLAVALWRAFVVTAMVPFVALLVLEAGLVSLRIGWRVVALGLFVLLARNAYLRARELDADARVAVWDGATGITQVLGAGDDGQKSLWGRVWAFHPSISERRAAVGDPARLFRAGFMDAAAAGIATAISLPIVIGIASLVAGSHLLTYFAGAGVVAPFTAGVLGLLMWRDVLVDATVRHTTRTAARVGAGLGVGYVVGRWISVDAGTDPVGLGDWANLDYLLVEVVTAILVTIGLVAIAFAFVASPVAWRAVTLRQPTPRWPVLLSLVPLVAALGAWLAAAMVGESVAESVVRNEIVGVALPSLAELAGAMVLLATISWTTLGILCLLWVYPMAVWFARSGPSTSGPRLDPADVARAARLDEGSTRASRGSSIAVSPWVAAAFGLAAGVVFFVGQLVVRAIAHAVVPGGTRGTPAFRVAFYDKSLLIAVAVALAAAFISARRMKEVPQPHGMMAGTIAGLSAGVAIAGASVISGCLPGLSLVANPSCESVEVGFVLDTMARVANGSLLLFLPLVAFVAFATVKRRRPSAILNAGDVRRRRPRAAEIVVMVLVMAATTAVASATGFPSPPAWNEAANRLCTQATPELGAALEAGDQRRFVESFAALLGDLRNLYPTGTDPTRVAAMLDAYELGLRHVLDANLANAAGDIAERERLNDLAVREFNEGTAVARELDALACQL